MNNELTLGGLHHVMSHYNVQLQLYSTTSRPRRTTLTFWYKNLAQVFESRYQYFQEEFTLP